jgi:hypothetical protein
VSDAGNMMPSPMNPEWAETVVGQESAAQVPGGAAAGRAGRGGGARVGDGATGAALAAAGG